MKTVLILGATSDIGKATAHRFARDGSRILLAARHIERLQDAKNDIKIRYNVPVETLEFDALKFDTHHMFYQQLEHKPDIAVCVFGYLGDAMKSENDFEEAHRIIDTNYTGAVSILHIVAEDMQKRRAGCIIGISSVAGDRGRQSNYVYGSAKAAFTTFLAGLRNRMFRMKVHVATIKPGYVRTRMTERMKLPGLLTAEPAQTANAIYRAWRWRKNVVYTLWMWRYIMLLIRSVPEFIFKQLSL